MNYEDKMRLMAWVKPTKKEELIARIAKGETVDITKDEDLFFQINRDRLSIDDQMNRDKYRTLANQMKDTRKSLKDPKYGEFADKKLRYLGDIPADIYFTHPWFSPNLPKHERDANIQKFFKLFPAFRAGEKQ